MTTNANTDLKGRKGKNRDLLASKSRTGGRGRKKNDRGGTLLSFLFTSGEEKERKKSWIVTYRLRRKEKGEFREG